MPAEASDLPGNPEETMSTYQADWSTFARRLTIVILLIGLVGFASLIGPVLQFIIFAAILAFILSYPVRMLQSKTRISYGAAAGIVYLSYLVLAIVTFLYLAIPAIQGLTKIATEVGRELPAFVEFLQDYTPDQGWLLDPETSEQLVNLNFVLEPLSQYAKGEDAQEVDQVLSTLAGLVAGLIFSVANFVTASIFIHIMAFFFLLELPSLYKDIIDRIPISHRPEYRILSARVLRVWVSFFRGTVVSAGLIGLLTLIQLLVMGIPNALTLALIIFVSSLIPMVGGLISLPALIFVTFTQGSTVLNLEPLALTLLVVVIHLIISQVIWQVYYPKQTGKTMQLPVSLVIVGLAVGAAIGGFLGVLLAAPVLGTVREFVNFLLSKIRGGNPYPEELIPETNP